MENLMANANSALKSARTKVTNVPYELHDLADYMALVSNNTINPNGLFMNLTLALYDIQQGKCGFNGIDRNEADDLIKSKRDTLSRALVYLTHFPLIVDNIASPEFSKEFRELFNSSGMLGEALPPVVEKTDYGCRIVKEGVVDISRKNRAEVLAALYNASKPQGLGFMQFDPTPMTVKEAKKLLKKTTYFDYLKGRVMKINFQKNRLLNTYAYNMDNGEGAAERAISSCPNIK